MMGKQLAFLVCILFPVQISALESKIDSFTTTFEEHSPLSTIAALAERMEPGAKPNMPLGPPYKISEESFELAVPKSYNPELAFGLLIWVGASDKGSIPHDWLFLLDKYRFIAAGANNSGNGYYADTRRIPLALDAAHNMQKLYTIDPLRIYVAGISGGGRVSSMLAMHYSDIFSGGVFMIGTNYWERMKIPGLRGQYWEPGMSKPQSKYLTLADTFGRYVFLTGDNDGNRLQTKAYFENGYRKYLKNITYIQVPGMGHEKPPAEWFEKALIFLDSKSENIVRTKQELEGIPEKKYAQPGQKGKFKAVFQHYHPLSSFGEIADRMKLAPQQIHSKGHEYNIENEIFEVCVPDSYDEKVPSGLLVWISPGQWGGVKKDWQPLLDKHNLIWVGANKSGNQENVFTRRIPFALDAVENMQKLYNIDPERIYVSGLSGGGRVSSMTAMHYPDVFTGGIFMIGVNFWERVYESSKKGHYWPPYMSKPQSKYLSRASLQGRYVLLTGDNDSNRDQTRAYYEKGYTKYLKNVLYIQVPDMSHEPPPVEWFDKAIAYLDS